MADWPDVSVVRDWIGVSEAEISRDQLELIMNAEIELQLTYLTFNFPDPSDPPEPIVQALLRRCARVVAARGLPLGTMPPAMSGVGAPYGVGNPTHLARWDAEVEKFESPYKLPGIA